MYRSRNCILSLLTLLLLAPISNSHEGAEPRPTPPPIRAAGISGTLVIVGGGGTPAVVTDEFRKLAGGDEARLVVIPTASTYAERDTADPSETVAWWKERGISSVTLLHTRDRNQANQPEFVEPLRSATAVWFNGGDQNRLAEAYLDTLVEKEIDNLLARGGVVGGTSAGAAIQSRVMIAGGNPVAEIGRGLDLLPGAVIDQHFLARNRKPRLLGVLEKNPGLVGFGIDERTALVVQGRSLRVLGESSVTVCLTETSSRPAQEIVLDKGNEADLTALRRAARDRLLPAFPPKEMEPPVVKSGSLVIVGGGGMPRPLVQEFIERAGGPDALIVILPTAEGGPIPEETERVGGVRMFTSAGARNVRVLYGRTKDEIDTPEQLELLKQAGGLWFGGGRQWRFVDAYEGTEAIDLFHAVLERGGVIGGSSAGATIQGDYLVRGSPLANTIMMADGYERGFAFLPGVAIDQHFSQRNRFRDLASVVDRYPQLLGIGIDESTALIVEGSVARVRGAGAVHFYDRRKSTEPDQQDHQTVAAGHSYDLVERRPID